MLFAPHAIVGGAIGHLSGNPFLGFFLGWLSHHILDSLPHFDQGSFRINKSSGPRWLGFQAEDKKVLFINRDWIILLIDILFAGAIFLWLFFKLSEFDILNIGAGVFGGLLPDILDVSPFWKEKFRASAIGKPYHKMHKFLHWPLSWRNWALGIFIQILVVVLALYSLT